MTKFQLIKKAIYTPPFTKGGFRGVYGSLAKNVDLSTISTIPINNIVLNDRHFTYL